MRERKPSDYIYNVRCDGFDPRAAIAIEPRELDLNLERKHYLLPWAVIDHAGGPLTRYLVDVVMAFVPPAEHKHILFTARPELIAGFPQSTPRTWHTDYAHGSRDTCQRQNVHNYAVITSAPCTMFLRESVICLPDTRTSKFEAAFSQHALSPFAIEPWSLVKFNATELHTATAWTGAAPTPRLFFRATYDPLRRTGN